MPRLDAQHLTLATPFSSYAESHTPATHIVSLATMGHCDASEFSCRVREQLFLKRFRFVDDCRCASRAADHRAHGVPRRAQRGPTTCVCASQRCCHANIEERSFSRASSPTTTPTMTDKSAPLAAKCRLKSVKLCSAIAIQAAK